MNESPSSKPGFPWTKLVVVAVVAAIVGIAFWKFGDTLSPANLAKHEEAIRQYQSDHPVLTIGAAFVLYVTVTGLALPGAAGLTVIYGWLFGFLRTLVLVSFASTMGATLAFLLSRYLLRDFVQNRFGDRLKSFNENLQREGPFYLFTLRLIPAVPFFVINVVMGLTPMKTRTFWWVSQIGMLAGTAVYTYLGSALPSLKTLAEDGISVPWQLLVAFAILGLLPLAAKQVVKQIKLRQQTPSSPS